MVHFVPCGFFMMLINSVLCFYGRLKYDTCLLGVYRFCSVLTYNEI